MASLWRVVKRRHARSAFDGASAQRFGGRWSSPGRPAVYASATKSLALLEVLVHLDVGLTLPRFVAFRFEVDDRLVEQLPAARLPRGWRGGAGLVATQRLGDAWLASRRALALSVPSVVVPEERNYLLNPLHPWFAKLRIGRAVPFLLDPRLRA